MVHTQMKFMDAHNKNMVFPAVILMTQKCSLSLCVCAP
jgi:hypothetical protein